jgi:probable rRNA maturation factor
MSPDDPHLLFHHSSRRVRRTPLRDFLVEIVRRAARGRGITCLITTDAELRRLNRQFRGKDYATDVLSFPPDEMAISLDRAAAQAKELGHSLDDELRILMLHGLLHLCGMDHETDAGQMRRAETRWRKQFGLPVGLIERTRC